MNAIDAAQHLVDRELSDFTGIEPHVVDVAAAALVERARRGSMEATVHDVLGRAEALSFAVGAATARPDARELVERAWNALDLQQQGFAANALGNVLAGIDVHWAWSLVAPAYDNNRGGSGVALLAALAGLEPALDARHAASIPAVRVLHDAVRDPVRARDLVVARCREPDSNELPFVSRLFVLAACALVDPVAALEVVERDDLWPKYGEAIELIARELHVRGDDATWLATMRPTDVFYRRAAWIAISTATEVVTGAEAFAFAATTFEDVYRNAEADTEATECYPLLSAYVDLGRVQELVDGADRVRMPPGMLADLLFSSGNADVAGAVIDAGGFERLAARPSAEWGGVRSSWGPSWWHDALDAGTALDTAKRVAALTGHTPWRHPPHSLGTFIELVRTVSTARD